ncbi:MAG TPA: R3H domain-containing nucleic acid-binding protein [Pyrinomonadaceae bacterium]|jgi:spoIIIJ-associated protein|nr:R3H domain-containing nucleic acid-binding protein [Pyrinomonadaceae bacterium]
MSEACNNATEFLSGLVKDLGFDFAVTSNWTDEGCCIDLTGEDSHFALAENGELLDALEVILFQGFGRDMDRSQRFVVDADGFRSTRKAELHAMARFAAEQVRKNGRAFTFGVLNSTERRIIHTSLQAEEDLITESVGDGRERRLQVRLQ